MHVKTLLKIVTACVELPSEGQVPHYMQEVNVVVPVPAEFDQYEEKSKHAWLEANWDMLLQLALVELSALDLQEDGKFQDILKQSQKLHWTFKLTEMEVFTAERVHQLFNDSEQFLIEL